MRFSEVTALCTRYGHEPRDVLQIRLAPQLIVFDVVLKNEHGNLYAAEDGHGVASQAMSHSYDPEVLEPAPAED